MKLKILIISDHKVSINKFNEIDINTRYLSPNASHPLIF